MPDETGMAPPAALAAAQAGGGLPWQSIGLDTSLTQQALYGMFGGSQGWAQRGYTGSGPGGLTKDDVTGDMVSQGGGDWAQFLKDSGYGYNYAADQSGFRHGQLTQNGTAVEGVPVEQWSQPNDQGFNIVRAIVLATMAGAGGYAGMGGDAGSAAGAVGSSLEEAAPAAAGAAGGGSAAAVPAGFSADIPAGAMGYNAAATPAASIGQWLGGQSLPALAADAGTIGAATAAAGGSSATIPAAGAPDVAGLTAADSAAYSANGDQFLQGGSEPAGFFSTDAAGGFSSMLSSLANGFGRGGSMQGIMQVISSLYGLEQSNRLKKNSQAPGMTKAGLQAVIRGMAAQGYQGSGNMMTALERYGADTNRGDLAGQAAGLSGELSSLGLLTSGISKLAPLFTGGG